MNNLTSKELARLIDISAVKTDSTLDDVEKIIEAAKHYNFICVFPMPCFLDLALGSLKDETDIKVGGVVGFPSGAETTEAKVFEAIERKKAGCKEVDMVMNIGWLKSGLTGAIVEEIRRVKEAVAPLPLKVIIEVPLLSDYEICTASQLVMEAKADFVKTGTGWSGSTTMHHVGLIKSVIGDSIKLKVAGGVRTLADLEEMYDAGVCRFGIGYKSALSIMEECIIREQKS